MDNFLDKLAAFIYYAAVAIGTVAGIIFLAVLVFVWLTTGHFAWVLVLFGMSCFTVWATCRIFSKGHR